MILLNNKIIEVPINQCVHFCAFRYGMNEYNPYETYIIDLYQGTPIHTARQRFIHFLQYYRPTHMGEALGIDLQKKYPLWTYPWDRIRKSNFIEGKGWYDNPNNLPDILTHFSKAGILSFRIDEEFMWLERALFTVRTNSYQPKKYGYVLATLLIKQNGQSSYLLLDGNHRVSAMSALGQKSVMLQRRNNIQEKDSHQWPGVQKNIYSHADALLIFDAYFKGNKSYKTTSTPARIIDSSC